MANRQKIVPGWVYSLADYCQMFDLTTQELELQILDFPAGISSFNAELTARGGQVISGDPSYGLSAEAMQTHAAQWLQGNKTFILQHLNKLRKQDDDSVQEVFYAWQHTVELFLKDYAMGVTQKRYQKMTLSDLAKRDQHFDLALCSDFLFHSHVSDSGDPITLVDQLCQLATEVRVYPLLTETGEMTDTLGPLMLQLQQNNFGVEVRAVHYEQLAGGNAMLRVWARECAVDA